MRLKASLRSRIFWKTNFAFILWNAFLFFIACTPFSSNSPVADGPCTETGNPNILVGTVVDANHKPVKGAKVNVLSINNTEESALPKLIFTAMTCDNGTFAFNSSLPANYVLEALDSLEGTVARWLPMGLGHNSQILLTLKKPGSLTGKVTRGFNQRPTGIVNNEKILIHILNTDKFLVTGTSGDYQIDNIAEGKYRISISAMDGHYLPKYFDSLQINSNTILTLPQIDLEWSPFVEAPILEGIISNVDSNHFVTLIWNKVKVSNLAGTEIKRIDSLVNRLDTVFVTDTVWRDSIKLNDAPKIQYLLRTVNQLGNRSAWSEPVTVSFNPNPELDIHALTLREGIPISSVKIMLWQASDKIDLPDSLPFSMKLVDSAITDLLGKVHFKNRAVGKYTLEATDTANGEAALARINFNLPNTKMDTLKFAATGSISGNITRNNQWVTGFFKQNENIRISLSGTSHVVYTDYKGDYTLKDIAPGNYQLISYALPESYFSPDTQFVTVNPSVSLVFPQRAAQYNPNKEPPKPRGFMRKSVSRNFVALEWQAITNYPLLKGYEVVRMDSALSILKISGLLHDITYTDTISTMPKGKKLLYALRVYNTQGKISGNVGDSAGLPIEWVVP